MDKKTDQLVTFSLMQVSEAGNSNRNENLILWEKKGIVPKQIKTNRHNQIRKYMREEEPKIDNEFDVWHFAKNIKKQLLAAGKKPSCRIIEKMGKIDWKSIFGGCVVHAKRILIFHLKHTPVFFFIYRTNISQQVEISFLDMLILL